MSKIANWTPTVIFVAGITIIILKVKEEEESYYPLKIIGYYLLGAFRFSFNKLHIPLGFIINLVTIGNPRKNQRAKQYAAILGLIAFLTGLIIPAISESYYERVRYVKPETTNIYELDFQSHWRQVAEALELDEHSLTTSRVENLNIDYEQNGKIKSLRYEAIWKENGELRHASIDFYEGREKVSVRAMKISQWLQYDRLIGADRLFGQLNKINIREITPQKDFPFYDLMFGGWDNFGIKDRDIFIIQDDRIVPFKGELPVKGYWIQTLGMEQTGEHSYTSVDNRYYLFDVQ